MQTRQFKAGAFKAKVRYSDGKALAVVVALGAVAFALYAAGAGWCFQYTLGCVAGKDLPWFVDAVAGVLLGQFVIPAALLCWVASFFAPVPFFGP